MAKIILGNVKGNDGIGISAMKIVDKHLKVTLTDGSVKDAGAIPDKKNYISVTGETLTAEWDNTYICDNIEDLDMTLSAVPSDNILHEITIIFKCDTTATTLSYPADIAWVSEPNIEVGKYYEININSELMGVVGTFTPPSSESESDE